MAHMIEVTKINNEKIAVNLQYVMTVTRSDMPSASTLIQFPPSAGTANTLYIQEPYETVMAQINQSPD